MLQNRTRTPLDLGSVANCYVDIILITALPISACHLMSARGVLPSHALSLSHFTTIVSPQRIIFPPGYHMSPSHHTKDHFFLHQTPLPPCLPQPHHAFHIPNAVPLHPMKYLLTWHIDTSDPQFAATTAHDASPLPHSTSPCRKPQVSASTPPTPPLSPAACQCTSPVSMFPLL